MLNNFNLDALNAYVEAIKKDPSEAVAQMGITAKWQGGVNTQIMTHSKKIGSTNIPKQFSYNIGEPEALLANNLDPNPQDYILGGMAGCMMVAFVAGATNKNIRLESVELTITGNLDLRGFLEVDSNVKVGFDQLFFNFDVKGDASEEQFNEIIEHVRKVSPGYRTIADPVNISINKSL